MVGTTGPGAGALWVVAAYLLAALLPGCLCGYALSNHRDSPTARAFAATMAAITLWSAAYLVRLFASSRDAQFALTVVAFAGVAFAPVGLILFALRYTDREQYVTAATTMLLSVVPVTTLLLLSTTGTHGLFYETFSVVQVAGLSTVDGTSGPWFWVHTAYSYGLLAVGSALLVAFGLTRRRLYRTQAAFLLLGVGVAWGSNALFLVGVTPLAALDLTPVGLAAGAVVLSVAVFRARLIDVTPVARDAVVAAMDDAVVVVEDGRVVDVNGAAERLLEAPRPVGRRAAETLPDPLVESLAPVGEQADGGQRVVDITRNGERRWYKLRIIPLDGDGTASAVDAGNPIDGVTDDGPDPAVALDAGRSSSSVRGEVDGPPATVLLLTDITAQKHHLRRLRKQNEQLEEFAAAAAHDLRNPLNVIDGYLELARESGDEAHFQRVEDATDRMSRLVEDLLALGRRGRLVESTSAVDLGEAAERAWRSIDAPDAELSVVPGEPVPADEDRLVQLLENLFANSVEHGSTSSRTHSDDSVEHGSTDNRTRSDDTVRITVGRTPDGFYVADDGTGVPPEVRERVFDYGYTTREGGTGFGLAIVETVADAHGWEVTVTESESGGARFEVTGVTEIEGERLTATAG